MIYNTSQDVGREGGSGEGGREEVEATQASPSMGEEVGGGEKEGTF